MKTTDEINALILIECLRARGIRRIIASPGTTNSAFVASVEDDAFFEVFSCVDERSAAYIACGMVAESAAPVVLSCTGATASRNYHPGLTEAFYRKLPILAVTSTQSYSKVGRGIPQVIDRSVMPKDACLKSFHLKNIKDADDQWEAELVANEAVGRLFGMDTGPVHVDLETSYSGSFAERRGENCRRISYLEQVDDLPELAASKVAVFIGAHRPFSANEVSAIERFCRDNNGVVLCDHTSNYHGKHRVLSAIVGSQNSVSLDQFRPDLLIHIGDISGDYTINKLSAKRVWRVNPDGEFRDPFKKLELVARVAEVDFFSSYPGDVVDDQSEYSLLLQAAAADLRAYIPNLPLSNIWAAQSLAPKLPKDCSIHFGILNSLRSWNFFKIDPSIRCFSNVGGFGIDGALSSCLGGALVDPSRLHYCVLGDLAFFYDINVLGNRHVGTNLRVLLINNGKGTEFRNYGHHTAHFGDSADRYIAAGGHFGSKSKVLVKGFVEALGFRYLSADSKESFDDQIEQFMSEDSKDSSIVFEVFVDSKDESVALRSMLNLKTDQKKMARKKVMQLLGKSNTERILKLIRR